MFPWFRNRRRLQKAVHATPDNAFRPPPVRRRVRLLDRALAPYRDGIRGLDRRVLVIVLGTFFFLASRIAVMTYVGIHFWRDLGIPLAVVGIAFLVENVFRGLVAPLMGSLSDRVGRRPLMLASVVASALLLPGFLLVRDVPTLLLWSAIAGAAQGAYFPVSSSLLLDLAPPARRQSVLALNYTMLSLGYILGVVPGGFLTSLGYPALAVAASGSMLAVAGLVALGVRGPLPGTGGAGRGTTLLLPFTDPVFLRFAALAVVFPLSVGLIALTVPVYASDAGGLDPATIGLALSVNGVVLALFALPVNVRLERRGPFRVLAASTIPLAAAFLLLSWGASVPLIVVGTTLFSFGELVFSAAAPTAAASLAPPGARGAYQGAWGLAFSIAVGSSLFLVGLVRDAFGWSAAWVMAAVVMAGAGLALLATRDAFRRAADTRGAALGPS